MPRALALCTLSILAALAWTTPAGAGKYSYQSGTCSGWAPSAEVADAIHQAFGSFGATIEAQARSVACCESGWGPTANVQPNNKGLFQITKQNPTISFYAVQQYGPLTVWLVGRIYHTQIWWSAWVNAMVSHDIYQKSGWSEWVCKP